MFVGGNSGDDMVGEGCGAASWQLGFQRRFSEGGLRRQGNQPRSSDWAGCSRARRDGGCVAAHVQGRVCNSARVGGESGCAAARAREEKVSARQRACRRRR